MPNRCHCPIPDPKIQNHVHEVQCSVDISPCPSPHNHRCATVSGEAIPTGSSHVHEVTFRTDYYNNHFHEYTGTTSKPIKVGNRHIHYINSATSIDDGHRHNFILTTFIENPIG